MLSACGRKGCATSSRIYVYLRPTTFTFYDLRAMFSFSSSQSPGSSPTSGKTTSFVFDNTPSGVLFASPNKTSSLSSFSRLSPYQKQGLGYLAFPPNPPPSPLPPSNNAAEEAETKAKAVAEAAAREQYEAQLKREAAARQARLDAERAEARRGEEAWVRMGGMLLNAEGRRDPVRTKAMKEDIQLRDVEEALNARWGAYEAAWQSLLSASTVKPQLRFSDIPWPVYPPPATPADVTMKKVESFLMDPLTVRGTTVTRKERIRSSLLRWHPDKLTKILANVVEEDVKDVEEAVSIVIRRLHDMNSRGK